MAGRIRDGLRDFFNMGEEEEDYDNYNEEYDEEDEYEETRKPLFRKKSYDGDDEYDERDNSSRRNQKSSKIVSVRQSKKGNANMELTAIKPTSFEEDGRRITDTLREGCTVVLNLDGIDVELAQRIIDFASGSCYAIDGNFRAVSKSIIVITPPAVEITGDFMDQVNGSLNITSFDF